MENIAEELLPNINMKYSTLCEFTTGEHLSQQYG